MDREAARQYIKDHLEDYLESEWNIDTRKPFCCLNPDHNDHKPSMSIDRSSRSGIHCKCFSCGAYYDTFDLIGIKYGLTDPSEIFNKAYEVFQIDRGGAYQKQPKSGRSERDPAPSKPIFDEPEDAYTLDLTNEAEAAHAELLQTPAALTYLQERGLTAKTVTEYKIGFDRLGYNHYRHTQSTKRRGKSKTFTAMFIHTQTARGASTMLCWRSSTAPRQTDITRNIERSAGAKRN